MNENEIATEVAKKAIEESVAVAKEFAGKLVNPALEEGGGLLQDTIKFWRFKNQINIVLKAKAFLEKKGIDPQLVLPKTAVPLLEKGSLENDETMQDRWAVMLANAASPGGQDGVKPSFPDVLANLSPQEVALLDLLFDDIISNPKRFEKTFDSSEMASLIHISVQEFEVILGNLIRLGICQPPASHGGIRIGEFPIVMGTLKGFCLTPFGYAFIQACKVG